MASLKIDTCNLTEIKQLIEQEKGLKPLIVNNIFNPVRLDDTIASKPVSPVQSDWQLAYHFYKSFNIPNWVSITLTLTIAFLLSLLALHDYRYRILFQRDKKTKGLVINLNQTIVTQLCFRLSLLLISIEKN